MDSQKVFATLTDGAAIDLSQVVAFFDSRYIPADLTKAMKDRKVIDLCSDGRKTSTKTLILTHDNLAFLVEAEVEYVCQLMRKNGFIVSD